MALFKKKEKIVEESQITAGKPLFTYMLPSGIASVALVVIIGIAALLLIGSAARDQAEQGIRQAGSAGAHHPHRR